MDFNSFKLVNIGKLIMSYYSSCLKNKNKVDVHLKTALVKLLNLFS